jgi:hypothetical protein
MERRQPPKTISTYASGVQKRNELRQQERKQGSVVPDLAQASVSHDPKRDGGKTLGQLGEEQRIAERDGKEIERHALRPQTIDGLKSIFEANQGAQAAKEAATVVVPDANPPPPPAAEPVDELDELDKLESAGVDNELLIALREARKVRERMAAEKEALEKRLVPIVIEDGFVTGEWKQVVPIIPDKLIVEFRSLSQAEIYQTRRAARKHLEKEPELEEVKDDLLSFYQTVAVVAKLGKTKYEPHMVSGTFDTTVFENKVKVFIAFPYALIAQLSLHGQWFDERVRQLFVTLDPIKNG